MEHWSRGADIVGSAGMLPAASVRTATDLTKARCSSVREKLSGNMPDRAGCKPALPFAL
jgi:isocitrate/isopropylmalate dehydrogenase